jgi:hypothetical protein
MLVLVCGALPCVGGGRASIPDRPADVLAEPDAADPIQPPEARTWVSVGSFTLWERGQSVEVRMYTADECDEGSFIRPTSLTVHAYYRAGRGPWQRVEVWRCSRAGWDRVGQVSPQGVELLFFHRRISIQLGQPLPNPPPPISRTLVLLNGVPTIPK